MKFVQGVTGDSIQIRIDAYSNSLIDMLKYPIIGSLWRENGGGHSALMDITSKYGWLGGYAFAMMFYHVPFHYKHHYNDKFIIAATNADDVRANIHFLNQSLDLIRFAIKKYDTRIVTFVVIIGIESSGF